jgi:hypothetical protein
LGNAPYSEVEGDHHMLRITPNFSPFKGEVRRGMGFRRENDGSNDQRSNTG